MLALEQCVDLVMKTWSSEVVSDFLFLFVLTDAIILEMDLQKMTNDLDNPPNQKLFV